MHPDALFHIRPTLAFISSLRQVRTRGRVVKAIMTGCLAATLLPLLAETPHDQNDAIKEGASLLKTDILGVFAHPDDETGVAATLAYYARGRNSVIANVYCTRGEGGGNMVGTHWGPALGHLREAELRDCLNTLGVRYCYFLDRLDWAYTESVAATLKKWDKEQTLEGLVRLVRELRPEVIVTMNPAPTPGQHGHHQAAGVLATEAFSAANDPNRFPLQLTKEGLTLWQPRKLYYGGGTTGLVATIDVSQTLPGGESPASIAAHALAHHRSQAFGNFGNSPWMRRPQRFTLIKSYVAISEPETDLLHGLPTVELHAFHFPTPAVAAAVLEFEPRPAVASYRVWSSAQHIEHVAAQFQPDLPVVADEANTVVLRLLNRGPAPIHGTTTFTAPAGWRIEPTESELTVAPGDSAKLKLKVTPPATANQDVDLTANVDLRDSKLAATAKLHPVPHAQVKPLDLPPAFDGSNQGWETVPWIYISSTNAWQGTPTGDADISGRFRVAQVNSTLFVDVAVTDDRVVSNIAPNDIKGHWRSDSIEICLDPAGGAENTMGCYKLGIFPFDATGAVRAARDADANQGPMEETAPKTRLFSQRTMTGYHIQAAIPFEEAGLNPTKQKRIGFNLLIYDGDKQNAAPGENINKSRIAWSPRSGVMGRPEDWGRMDLE